MHYRLVAFIFIIVASIAKGQGHIGCVSYYDVSLCETEKAILYKSDRLTWELTKDQFKTKLISFLDSKLPGHAAKMATVFLWVSDFDSHSALRVQVWSETSSTILSFPIDIENIDAATDVLFRIAGTTPYPVDFGYTPGEVLILCQSQCGSDQLTWLKDFGFNDVKSLGSRALVIKVANFTEAATVENLKLMPDFSRFFSTVELSPVLEGNGYRELAFTVYFTH